MSEELVAGLFYGVQFYLAVTSCGTSGSGAVGDLIKATAQKKTITYMAIGLRGETPSLKESYIRKP
jgi:hypothetical protein